MGTGTDESVIQDASEVHSDRLEKYRTLINTVIQRNPDHQDKVLADELQMDRSYFSKMRRGQRAIPPRIVEYLIDRLNIDRVRLGLAVDMMKDPDSYFDPALINICTYVQVVIWDTMNMAKASGDAKNEFHIGTLSKDRCEALAQEAVEQFREQFEALGAVPCGQSKRRVA